MPTPSKWRAENPEANAAIQRKANARYRERHPYRVAFATQRANANRRGISFEFSFIEWMKWWGSDIATRGRHSGQLVMARYNDIGPYNSNNVFKHEAGANASDSLRSNHV